MRQLSPGRRQCWTGTDGYAPRVFLIRHDSAPG